MFFYLLINICCMCFVLLYIYKQNKHTMERIKILLQHIIDSATINEQEEIALCATVFLGSIEKNCVNELADKLEEFTKEKVQEIIFIEQVEKMINYN